MRIYEYKGSWYFQFDIERHPVSGKRRQVKKGGFGSEREAEKAGVKAQVEHRMGSGASTERITFGEMAQTWFDEYQNNGQVKRTSATSRMYAVKVLLKYFDKIAIKKMKMNLIQDVVNQLSDKYSRVYTREVIAVLRMIFKKAKQLGYLNSDPSEFVYIPNKRKSLEEIEQEPIENKYMEKDTLKRFLDVARDFGLDFDYLLFRLMAYTGMRVGEVLALKWSDIDFDTMSISVNRRITHETNNLSNFDLDTPKTNSSKRTITVDPSIIAGLKELKTQQHWFRSKFPDTADFGFVFINLKTRKGYPQTQKHVELRLKRILRMAGITQNVTPHTFRHTHTSLMAEAGVDLNTIMERLGHKNDDITRGIYLHITKSLKQEAVVKFAKLMDGEK
jgi:integrase